MRHETFMDFYTISEDLDRDQAVITSVNKRAMAYMATLVDSGVPFEAIKHTASIVPIAEIGRFLYRIDVISLAPVTMGKRLG